MRYLLGFVLFMLGSSLFAAEGPAGGAVSASVYGWIAAAAGFGIAIASAVGAIAQSKVVHRASEAIARNPGTAPQIRFGLILGLVLIESLVIYTLLIEILLVGKIKL